MEHKFANIQTEFDSLSVLKLGDHSKWRAKKIENGKVIMLIRTFVLKEINHERKRNNMKSLIALQNKLRRYSHRRICALLNSVQNFMEVQGWLLLTFFVCSQNQLSSFNSIILQMSEKPDSSNRQ